MALAALLGLAMVGVPASLGVYWQVSVEPGIEHALATRLSRRVLVGSARPLLGGVRLVDVVVFGAPPFEKVPLLSAAAVDVDLRWRSALAGRVVIDGLTVHRARLAVVRDAERGGDNLGDLTDRIFRPHAGRAGEKNTPIPVHLDGGSLQIAYRDSGGARWGVRADDLDAQVLAGSGSVQVGRIRVEVGDAAAEFGLTRFEVENGRVRRARAEEGRLRVAGAEDLLAQARLLADHDGDQWRLRAQAPQVRVEGLVGAAGTALTIEADRLPLAPLRPLGDPLGVGTRAASLDAHLEVRVRPQLSAIGLAGSIEVAGVTITNPRVTTGAVENAGLRVAGSLVAAPREGRVAVDQAVVRVGDLALWVRGAVEGLGDKMRGELEAHVDETPCQAALESMPAGLLPALEGGQLGGVLSARGHFRFDALHLDDLLFDFAFKDRCVVLRDPPKADVTRLRAPVVAYRVEDETGRSIDFPLGPVNPNWRPLSRMSPHLPSAFLTAEDARFYSHRGFEPEYIRRAFIENLRRGRVVKGASTISQQLVKNLFLEKARTVSRKLQEAALTWRLEQAVPKRRILELYLNAIELGPGTFGVRQAARRYFGKEPSALTPLEAAHLASVAPSPKGYWARFHRGPVGDDWMEKLYDLVGMMHRSHRLSDVDFAAAVAQKLRFLD
jgi:hypothetical protein